MDPRGSTKLEALSFVQLKSEWWWQLGKQKALTHLKHVGLSDTFGWKHLW